MSLSRMLAALALASAIAQAGSLPDAPPTSLASAPSDAAMPSSYRDALRAWASPEDIARFAGARFVYDRARALALAEPTRASPERPSVRAPEETFDRGSDLARFAVETLNRLDAAYAASYLMIEFEPVTIEGRTLRRHWIASFRRDGALWFFADSTRPAHIAGPYASAEAFVADYAAFRDRSIVAWREVDSYARGQRSTAKRSREI
jgi:hypothetical protein